MTEQAMSATIEKPVSQSAFTEASIKRVWIGRVLSGLAALFCVMDGGMKLVRAPLAVQATAQLGYPDSAVVGIGCVLLICTVFYIIPRTALVGAVLLSGYLGGAVASKVRVSAPAFDTLFPVAIACLAWAGLYLRDIRLRSWWKPSSN